MYENYMNKALSEVDDLEEVKAKIGESEKAR